MKHYINGVEIRPVNAENMGIKWDFTGNAEQSELNYDSLILTNDAYKSIMEHVNNSVGIFEGVPYTVEIGTFTFECFIDLTNASKFSDSEMECQIRLRNSFSWFIERANNTTWESINLQQGITGGFKVPYIIVKDNQVELLLMLSISTYTMTRELISAIRDLVVIITAPTIQASTPNAGVAPSMDTGDIVALVLKIAAQAIYTTAVALALTSNVLKLIELFVPKVRYFNAMKVKDLLTQGSAFLGKQFESTALDGLQGMTILPVPLQRTNKSIFDYYVGDLVSQFNKHYPTAMDYSVSTVGGLFEEIRKAINGKIFINGNTVRLERRDYNWTISNKTFKNTLNIQSKRENQRTYNFGETWKRYLLHYNYDTSDSHTMDKISGQIVEKSTEPITTINSDIVTIKGYADVNIGLSLGYRKNDLNFVEKRLLEFAELADSVANFFGANSSLSDKITGRIGVLQISQQHFSNTKLLYTIGGKQPQNFADYIGADALYNKFHFINEVKDNFKSIEESTIPFAPIQLEALNENNVMFDEDGNELEILNFEWINGAHQAKVELAEKSNLAFNTKTITL